MTAEPQQAVATDPTVAKIEGRVTRIESLLTWIYTLMVLSMVAGLILGIVIAVELS